MAQQFRAVLDSEKRWLGNVSRAGDFVPWRLSVVREVMNRRSPYALVLRRGQGTRRQSEFLHCWQLLIAETLQRVAPPQGGPGGCAPAPAGLTTEDPEHLAVAILAALHGGAALSWLAEDRRCLEAALDIALAPVLGRHRPERPDLADEPNLQR